MNTLDELKKLNIKDEDMINFLSKLEDIDIHSFKIIYKDGYSMVFNNFLVASDDEYLDLIENNAVSDLPKNFIIFATGPDGEEYAINNTDNSVSCFLLDVEEEERTEVQLAKSFKDFIQLLESIKPIA